MTTVEVVENLPQEEERISDDPSISNSERNGLDDLSGEDSFPEDERPRKTINSLRGTIMTFNGNNDELFMDKGKKNRYNLMH
ncbi:hypothetical protein CsSME_00036926 [Camellia sinensis var. sinensis]